MKKHADYLALLTEKSISIFCGEVSKDVFFDDDAYDAMPDRLTFQFERWINKDLGNVDCHWDFDNTRGEVSWGLLIAGGFKYIGSKVPRRDGLAAARAAAAAPPRPPRIVKVEYEESGEKKQQEWEYMEPEDVTVCQRERQGHPNFAPKLNIDLDMVTTPFDMWLNASFPPEQLLADERFANLRLAGTDSHKRKTTAGEMLLVRMLMLLAAVHYPNVPVKKLFQEHRLPREDVDPPNFGKFRISFSKNRFFTLLPMLGKQFMPAEEDKAGGGLEGKNI